MNTVTQKIESSELWNISFGSGEGNTRREMVTQCACLENSVTEELGVATVHGVGQT